MSVYIFLVPERMGLVKGSNFIDHDDGDKLNCTRSNLRVPTNGQNRANSKLNCNNLSGVKGVHWDVRKCKWVDQINANSQKIHLSYYDDLLKAKEPYDWASKHYFGQFARS